MIYRYRKQHIDIFDISNYHYLPLITGKEPSTVYK